MTEPTNKKSWIMKALENERFVNQANYILSIVTTFLGAAVFSSWQSGQISPILLPLGLTWMMAFSFKLLEMYIKAVIEIVKAKARNVEIEDSMKLDIKKSIEGFKYMGKLITELVVSTQATQASIGDLLKTVTPEVKEHEPEPESEPSPRMVEESGRETSSLGPDPNGVFAESDGPRS